jgi:ATP-binding cassette, subfamily B, bacterial PglK
VKSFFRIINLSPFEIKRGYYFYLFCLFFSSILELLGIGLIIPLVSLWLNDQYLNQIILKYNLSFLEIFISNKETLLSLLIILFIAVFISKNLLLTLLLNYRNKLSAKIHEFFSIKLLNSYLNVKYDAFNKNSKAVLIKNIFDEVNIVRFYVLLILIIITELIVALTILCFLIYIYPDIFILLISVMIICFLVINLLFRRKMTEVGRIRVQKSAKIFQILNDIFFNIKDIILKDKKKYFADLYQKNLNIFTTSVAKGQSIVEGTRYIIEIVFILVLSLLMYFSSHLISDKNEFIKFISIFLIAAYRIIPSINRISQSYNDSKSSFQSLKLVENILKINYQNQDNVINKSNLIKKEIFNNDSKIIIENLSYNFSSNGNNIELFKNFNLEFNCNLSIGIFGESGSGKSTLLNIFTGLISPKEGRILINNININDDILNWRNKFSYISQDISLIRGTLRDNILIDTPSNQIDDKEILDLLEKVELKSFLQDINFNLNHLIDTEGSNISGGQKQRLAIARAIFSNPKILILDEATSGLDTETEDKIVNLAVNKLTDITRIFVSHKISNLKNCDIILEIKDNKIERIK